jgi:alkanesulfonate monooxygenase SsuD/methylene tetrahydromethanopterin reductase-like flavin-dependent oxidoreductase (luciferase family)
MKTRVSRFIEVLQVARRLLTEPEVTHEGRHFRLHRVALTLKPVQRPHPPVCRGHGGEIEGSEPSRRRRDEFLKTLRSSEPVIEID